MNKTVNTETIHGVPFENHRELYGRPPYAPQNVAAWAFCWLAGFVWFGALTYALMALVGLL